MISVCITLRFSLRHLSNLEDHVPSFKIIFHVRKQQRIKKNKTKRNLTGMHQPLKRGKQMYFTVLKMQKTFHSSNNLFFPRKSKHHQKKDVKTIALRSNHIKRSTMVNFVIF